MCRQVSHHSPRVALPSGLVGGGGGVAGDVDVGVGRRSHKLFAGAPAGELAAPAAVPAASITGPARHRKERQQRRENKYITPNLWSVNYITSNI